MGQTGIIEISASESEGGKWVRAYHRIYKVIDGVKDDSQTASFTSYKKKVGNAKIAIGKYIIKSEYNNSEQLTPFEVKAGKTSKIHVIFSQFLMGAKCSNMEEQVSYEVYASSGQLMYEKKSKCANILKVPLDKGNYSVEAKISTGSKEMKFSVGSEHPNRLILDLTNLNHEEEIKADSQESEKITLGTKEIEITGISKKDAEQIKNLGAVLGVLSGVMQANTPEKKVEEETNNTKVDKEFEDMSKDLEMYTK